MTEKYIDFDAYRKEKEDDKIIIKAFKKELKLPPSPKLSVIEKVLEMRNKKGDEHALNETEVFGVLENLLGKKQFRELVDKGITSDEAEWLMGKLWNVYNPSRKEDDTKNKVPSTSQKNGVS